MEGVVNPYGRNPAGISFQRGTAAVKETAGLPGASGWRAGRTENPAESRNWWDWINARWAETMLMLVTNPEGDAESYLAFK